MIHGHLVSRPNARDAPYLDVGVEMVAGGGFSAVSFLVDTGADHTILHPADAIRVWGIAEYLSYNFTGDPTLRPMGGIGGSAFYIQRDVTFQFTDDTIGVMEGPHQVWIAVPDAKMMRLPSLIGRDVIDLFIMHVDLRGGVAFELRDGDNGVDPS